MIKLASPELVNEFGDPLVRVDAGKVRTELADSFAKSHETRREQRRLSASYDAASSSDEFKNYWANTDAYDADSAASPSVRAKLVQRSRYEIANNGFADGIASTYANDLIGLGPTLRMQTSSDGFNRLVELAWWSWTQEIKFRRKLWCMAHAKHSDGEGIAVLRQNKKLRNRIKLEMCLHETEECQSPYLPFGKEGLIDGIQFDEFGNPEFFEFLKQHPGSNQGIRHVQETELIPARYVMHWFRMKRPGQHRGIPEMSSTLNLGAASRRFREAVLGAAENIADFSLFIKTQFEPDQLDSVSPMSTLDIQKRMMTALPAGYDAFQPKAEQPTSTFSEFSKTLISEQARPKSMPLNKAACDSSNYNYASGRLDHSTYYGSLDVDRQDCNDVVLDPLFEVWFEMAVVAYGWLGGDPEVISEAAKAHTWDWPKHQVADIKSEAQASDTRLKNGMTSLPVEYSNAGLDYEDDLVKQAASNGVTVDQQRQINLLLNVPQHAIQAVSSLLGLSVMPTAPPSNGDGNVQQNSD